MRLGTHWSQPSEIQDWSHFPTQRHGLLSACYLWTLLLHKDGTGYLQQRCWGLQSLKYLLPGPFQEKRVGLCLTTWWLSLWYDGRAVTLGYHQAHADVWTKDITAECHNHTAGEWQNGQPTSLWSQVCKPNGYELLFSRKGLSTNDCCQPKPASQSFLLEGLTRLSLSLKEPFVHLSSFVAHEASLRKVVKDKYFQWFYKINHNPDGRPLLKYRF